MADNAIFNVNGEGEELLKETLALAFKLSILGKAWAWSIDKDKGLILHWHEKEGTPFPTPMTAEGVFPIVWAFLQSDQAKDITCVGWDANIDQDGYNSLGWRVYTEEWGRINNKTYSFLAIKPAYIWHGK